MKEVRFSLYINSLICEIWSDLYDFSPKGRLNFYFDTPSHLSSFIFHLKKTFFH